MNKSYPQRAYGYGVPLVRALLGAALLAAPSLAAAQQIGIAAIVNDAVVSTVDVAERRDFILATSDVPATVEAQAQLTPRVLDALITEALELQEAKRLGISVLDSEIEKAKAAIEARQNKPEGSLTAFIRKNNLSERTLENQLRAQVAWDKLVERKLRRSVSISEDEIRRAQLAQAAAPGITERRLISFMLPVSAAKNPQQVMGVLNPALAQLAAGGDVAQVLGGLKASAIGKNLKINAPLWVPDAQLPAPILAALEGVSVGQFAPPLQTPTDLQFLGVIGQRVLKPLPDSTEMLLKQVRLDARLSQAAQMAALQTIRTDATACADPQSPAIKGGKVTLERGTYGQMSPPMRTILGALGVGEWTEPMKTPEGLVMMRLCERISPPDNLPDADTVRRQLYAEKLELEAQKYLRNLRRDAFIERKDGAN